MGPYKTVAEIKAADKKSGGYFFSPGAMKGFSSRVLPGVYGGRYFITSEQFEYSDGTKKPREYCVRTAHDSGRVTTTPGLPRFKSSGEARKAAKELAAKEGE